MKTSNDRLESQSTEAADELLQKLFHLKRYELPDDARMAKNRQNILREVRAGRTAAWTLADLVEVNIPWFFAEPRYGIAALFIVFASLQFWGVSAQKQAHDKNEMVVPQGVAVADVDSTIYTNSITYPKLPDDLGLFPDQKGDSSVKFVGRVESK